VSCKPASKLIVQQPHIWSETLTPVKLTKLHTPPPSSALQILTYCYLQDQLRRLAVKQGSLMIGTRYWAKQALTAVLSHLQADSMKQILQHPQATQNMPETGALMVVS